MFSVGEKIIYGKKGVCVVKSIGSPGFSDGEDRLYYTLSPQNSTETIFVPVDSGVFMRPVITRAEALELIDRIPEIESGTELDVIITKKELPEFYKKFFETHSCEDLVRLILIAKRRTERANENKRKPSQTEREFIKGAENILYGELAEALGIGKGEVADLIADRTDKR